ncbi:MAG: tRNA (N6-isopentenyl adenosine(37)-C2)-methylthiotransferase MiaB, partial [Clostridia bacterium]|nr:tRNA (N6-isopentenyl adenosine(37)-C2)-methylthiotransferase MiaB [Clostridia bacterium]
MENPIHPITENYISLVRNANDEHFAATGLARHYFVDTYGCQQNESDSEILRGLAEAMGYLPASDPKEADLIVVNTCAVREHAEMRILGNVGSFSHIKKANPDLIIVMTGCMMSEEHMRDKIKHSFPYVSG